MQRLAVQRLVESPGRARTQPAVPTSGGHIERVIALQRTAGNRAVAQMLQRCAGGACGCGGDCSTEQRSCGPGCTCPKCSGAAA